MANNGIYYSSGNSLNFTTNNTTWATITSGGTFVINTISGGTYLNYPTSSGGTSGDYLPLSGGTVTGGTIFQSGVTANTISATTYQNLPQDVFVTGGTYTAGSATFTNTTGGTFSVNGFPIGGGGGQTFYLNLSQTQNGNRLLSTTASTSSEQTSGVTINNGVTGTIASFQSQPLNITLLPGGIWSFYLHSYKENSNAVFNIFVELYKITSGGTQTLLFSTDPTPVTTNSPNPSMQLTDGYFSGTTLSISDSVVAVVRATNTGNQSHTITLVTEGSSHYSYVVSTIPTQQGLTCETLSGCSIIQTIQTNITNKFDKSGGTVTGGTIFQSGVTANTISATTYFNLPISAVTGSTGISASTSNGTVTITNTAPNQTVTISGGTGITTGGTYPNFTILNSAPDQTVTITGGTNIQIAGGYPNFGVNFTGTTGSNFTGGTVSGATNFTGGLTATTVSATTYLNLPYSGTVNGGGTTNYIPKFTGLTGIGNSQLQDDGSQVFTNQGYGSTLTGNLSINASGTTGIAGRATQYGVYGTISGTTAGASAIYGEAGKSQYGVYGLNQGDAPGEYIGAYGRSQQSDSGTAGTVYIGGKFYGDNGTGGGYSVQLQDGTEGVAKVLVSQTSDGKANWNTFSGINITITSAATNTLVFSAATGGGGGVTSVTAGSGLSGNTTTGAITLITNISASSISNSTTVGQNLITIPNPSEIRYLRINANNSITTLTLAQLKTDLGIGSAVVSIDQTTTGAVYQNVTALTYAMTSGKTYKWRATIWVTTTTTANFSTNGPAGTTIYRFTLGSGQSTNFINNGFANNTGTVVGVGNNRIVSADGIYVATATGPFNISMISLSTGGVVVKAGSIIEFEEVL